MTQEQSFQELQGLVQQLAGRPANQRAVLLLQSSSFQGQVWQAALSSQGIVTLWEPNPVNPAHLLDQLTAAGAELPLALILDVATLSANPYAFCRWCREHYPTVKIILTNASAREISPPEHHWATYQGAQDLLPGFQAEVLVASVAPSLTRVLVALGWRPLQSEPLNTALAPFLAPPQRSAPPRPLPITSPTRQGLIPPPVPPVQGTVSKPSPQSAPIKPQPQPPTEAAPPRKTYRGIAY